MEQEREPDLTNVVMYARPYFVTATMFNAHVNIGKDLSDGALDHCCKLCDALLNLYTGNEDFDARAHIIVQISYERLMASFNIGPRHA